MVAILVLGGGHGHASLSGLINHPCSWQPGLHQGPMAFFFFPPKFLAQKTRILSRPFSLSVVPHEHGLIRGSVREWCRGGEKGGREGGGKSYQTVVLCLSQKCNMIYSGICKSNNHSRLVYRRDLLIHSLKGREGGRQRDNPHCKSQPTERAPRQTPATKSMSSLRISKQRVSDNFPLVSQCQMPSDLFGLAPILDASGVISNVGLTVCTYTVFSRKNDMGSLISLYLIMLKSVAYHNYM